MYLLDRLLINKCLQLRLNFLSTFWIDFAKNYIDRIQHYIFDIQRPLYVLLFKKRRVFLCINAKYKRRQRDASRDICDGKAKHFFTINVYICSEAVQAVFSCEKECNMQAYSR